MKKILIALLAIVLISFISCKEDKKVAKELTQMEQVMAIHDEVMPKLSTINSLHNKLDDTRDKMAKKDLADARAGMMDWMRGFGERFNGEEILNGKALSPEKQEWLDEEEAKVKTMRDKINNSIKNAETILTSKK